MPFIFAENNFIMKRVLLIIFCLITITASFGQATANQPSNLMICDDVPFDGFAVFDLTVTTPEILGSQDPSNFLVTYYETVTDAQNGVNQIVNPITYFNISNPQTIYARVENISNSIFATTNFELVVLDVPNVFAPTPLEVCDDNADGFSSFNLTDKDDEISAGDPSLAVTYHETLADAINGINALLSPYQNITPFIQIIYINITNINTGCTAVIDMDILVLEKPLATQPNNLYVNDGDGDGVATFNLTENDLIVAGASPNATVFYYETEADAQLVTNEISSPEAYENTANPQTIYVVLQNSDTSCYDASQSFAIATDETTPLADSDNDGVPDVIEDLNSNGDLTDDNTDGDAFPNFEDDDDDGDGTPTIDEDYNNNGSPTDDDRNSNGIPDYLDDGVTLGLDVFLAETIAIFPNPTQNNVTIQWDASSTVETIAVYTLDGKLIRFEVVSATSTTAVVDISAVTNGMYFIKISTQKGTLIEKIIKK